MIKITVRTVKFGSTDFTAEPLPSADLNDTFGFVDDNFVKSLEAVRTADPAATQNLTTSTAFTDIPGMELNVGVTANVKVLVMLNLTGSNNVDGATSDYQIDRDGAAQSLIVSLTDPQGAVQAAYPTTVIWLDTPGAGTAVFKGRFRTTAAGTAVAVNSSLTAVELGQ